MESEVCDGECAFATLRPDLFLASLRRDRLRQSGLPRRSSTGQRWRAKSGGGGNRPDWFPPPFGVGTGSRGLHVPFVLLPSSIAFIPQRRRESSSDRILHGEPSVPGNPRHGVRGGQAASPRDAATPKRGGRRRSASRQPELPGKHLVCRKLRAKSCLGGSVSKSTPHGAFHSVFAQISSHTRLPMRQS